MRRRLCRSIINVISASCVVSGRPRLLYILMDACSYHDDRIAKFFFFLSVGLQYGTNHSLDNNFLTLWEQTQKILGSLVRHQSVSRNIFIRDLRTPVTDVEFL